VKNDLLKRSAILGILALGVGTYELMADACDANTLSECETACGGHGGMYQNGGLDGCEVFPFPIGIVSCVCEDGTDQGWAIS
jgi:hypothetical protein